MFIIPVQLLIEVMRKIRKSKRKQHQRQHLPENNFIKKPGLRYVKRTADLTIFTACAVYGLAGAKEALIVQFLNRLLLSKTWSFWKETERGMQSEIKAALDAHAA